MWVSKNKDLAADGLQQTVFLRNWNSYDFRVILDVILEAWASFWHLGRPLLISGAMKQGMNQLLIDAAKNQFSQYTNSPYQSIGLLSQALGASPVPQTTTTSKQPGLFDYLTLGAGM